MHPAQRVAAHCELSGVIAQDDRVAQKIMCVDAAPDRPFGGDLDLIGSRSEPMPRKAVSGLRCGRQFGEA
jgi:hypothetical protein